MTTINLWAGESFEFEATADISVNGQELSAEMVDHVIAYGLRQLIRDAAANAKADPERNALAHKKLEGLLNGTLRSGSGNGGKRMDPTERWARQIALRKVTVAAAGKGWTQKKLGEYAEALFTRDRDDLMVQAAEEMAAETEASGDILADLGL